MAKGLTIVRQVQQRAKEIIASRPGGIRPADLEKMIKNESPEKSPNTIHSSVWKLCQHLPPEIEKRGELLCSVATSEAARVSEAREAGGVAAIGFLDGKAMNMSAEIQYVMVTDWNGYWDAAPRPARYPERMIHGGKIGPVPGPVTTLFVKVSKKRLLERAWNGTVSNIRVDPQDEGLRIFDFTLEKETHDTKGYEPKKPGWYLKKSDCVPIASDLPTPPTEPPNPLRPGFIHKLLNTRDPHVFEESTWHLLRVLGVHRAYQFAMEAQAGQADGFFRFDKMAVLYDCTLRTPFDKEKDAQIVNYCALLDKEALLIHGNLVRPGAHQGDIVVPLRGLDKQVWIVTRGKRPPRTIRQQGDVRVREVPVAHLIELYDRRLLTTMDEEALCIALRQ